MTTRTNGLCRKANSKGTRSGSGPQFAGEVKEETKCVAKVCKFGSVSHYWVKNRPKIVVFFDMAVEKEQFKPSGEVRALKWITPDEALRQLTHLQERQVLQACIEFD